MESSSLAEAKSVESQKDKGSVMNELKWDRKRFLQEIDGDLEMGEELLNLFLESARELLKEIEEALRAKDLLRACERAHSLKGAAGTVHLEAIREEAFALETARHPEEAWQHLRRLKELFQTFQEKAEGSMSWRELLD